MNVTLKTPDDIAKMREAGRLAAEVLDLIGEHVRPVPFLSKLSEMSDFLELMQHNTKY